MKIIENHDRIDRCGSAGQSTLGLLANSAALWRHSNGSHLYVKLQPLPLTEGRPVTC